MFWLVLVIALVWYWIGHMRGREAERKSVRFTPVDKLEPREGYEPQSHYCPPLRDPRWEASEKRMGEAEENSGPPAKPIQNKRNYAGRTKGGLDRGHAAHRRCLGVLGTERQMKPEHPSQRVEAAIDASRDPDMKWGLPAVAWRYREKKLGPNANWIPTTSGAFPCADELEIQPLYTHSEDVATLFATMTEDLGQLMDRRLKVMKKEILAAIREKGEGIGKD